MLLFREPGHHPPVEASPAQGKALTACSTQMKRRRWKPHRTERASPVRAEALLGTGAVGLLLGLGCPMQTYLQFTTIPGNLTFPLCAFLPVYGLCLYLDLFLMHIVSWKDLRLTVSLGGLACYFYSVDCFTRVFDLGGR